jgi:23S rRNA pseudouridine2605 synthase
MSKNSPFGERPSLGKRKTDNFSKFYNKKRNSAIKEAFRQEKKTAKKDRKQAIERHFEDRRKTHTPQPAPRNLNPAPGKPIRGVAPANPSHKTRAAANPVPHTPANPAQRASSTPTETLPLNKYIAHGGICSRRDAAELVRQGKVTVNGQLITEPGTKVHPTDTVKVGNKKVTISNNFVYILLNKPKDYITTTDDPQGRRTVLDLIRPATTERVFPIGRLDRNTSGVLLLTNDGDLAQKLAHPSHQIRKIYHVTLDKPLTKADFDKIAAGAVTLDDGPAPVDDLAYADPKDKSQIGIEIHSGRNRIVRRIFEQLGYDVRGLDRVMYAGLTKKNVQRGHWRLLADKEVRILKYLNSSFKGSPGRAKDMAAPATAASHAPAAPSKPATPAPKPATAPKTATPKPATPKPTPKSPKTHKPFKPHAPKPPK